MVAWLMRGLTLVILRRHTARIMCSDSGSGWEGLRCVARSSRSLARSFSRVQQTPTYWCLFLRSLARSLSARSLARSPLARSLALHSLARSLTATHRRTSAIVRHGLLRTARSLAC